MKTYRDIRYSENHRDNVLDLYVPETDQKPPLIVYIHGGGWAIGDKNDDLVRHWTYLINRGYALASINYRMNKEGRHPNGFLDVQDAVKFLYDNAKEYGYDPDRIGLVGESAGGFYSLFLAATNDQAVFGREALNLPIKVCVSLYAPVDFYNGDKELKKKPYMFFKSLVMKRFIEVYFNKLYKDISSEDFYEASPVNYINENLPPVLYQQGTKDNLNPPSQAKWLKKKVDQLNLNDRVKIELMKDADHIDAKFFTKKNKDRIEKFLGDNLK